MLRRRLISAFIIISVMLLLLWFDFWLGTESALGRPGLVLCLLAILTAALAASELVNMWQNSASPLPMSLIVFATIVMVMISCATGPLARLSTGLPDRDIWMVLFGGCFGAGHLVCLGDVTIWNYRVQCQRRHGSNRSGGISLCLPRHAIWHPRTTSTLAG